MRDGLAHAQAAADSPPLGEGLEFLQLVWGLHHALERASRRMNETFGVTGPQRLVIRLVGRFPGITAGQLASLIRVHPGTLSGILKRLQARGLVSRRSDPRDRRRVCVGLTEAGRHIDASEPGTIESAVATGLQQMPETARAHARGVLRAMVEAIGLDDTTARHPKPGELMHLSGEP